MNRYFADRFEEIRDALPSAAGATLRDLRDELERLVAEIDERLAERRERSPRPETPKSPLGDPTTRVRV